MESQVLLSRTTPSGMQSVCPNEIAVFTCQVTGSNIISWSSPEYFTSTLEFTITSMEGMNNTSNGVVAVLTRNSGGILESQLHIRASVDSSIRCLSGDVNSGETVILMVTDGMFIQFRKKICIANTRA